MQPREKRPSGTADIADRANRSDDFGEHSDTDIEKHDYDERAAFNRPDEHDGPRRDAADAFERTPGGTTGTRREADGPNAATDGGHERVSTTAETRSQPRPDAFDRGDQAGRSRSFPGTDDSARSSTAAAEDHSPLLDQSETGEYRQRWEECQRSFVDEPRDSVKAADELVAEVMQKLASQFADTRSSLEQQWDRGDNVSTEDLRLALQRYRDFFNRLLAA